MDKHMEYQPISRRLQKAILNGAGLDLKRVLGVSLDVQGPGEISVCVRIHLDDEHSAAVMAAIAAVDLTVDEWA